MPAQSHTFSVRLFYSYSHKDEQYRDDMEKALALLKRRSFLSTWSDHNIIPGESISAKVKSALGNADIVVFLISSDFIASHVCCEEWNYACSLADSGRAVFRIPIILRECAWREFLGEADLLALPKDGQPVVSERGADLAWREVYEGIAKVIEKLRSTFQPKKEFLKELERTEFLGAKRVSLSDIFVFPHIVNYSDMGRDDSALGLTLHNESALLKTKLALIHGEHMSGKTALARHLFLHLARQHDPVVLLDLQHTSGRLRQDSIQKAYACQFTGDYSLWSGKPDKTLIIDNLSHTSEHLEFISDARNQFDRVVVTTSTDVYQAYFRDETRLADFSEIRLHHMTHKQQEKLIRRRLELAEQGSPILDGRVDQVERRINSIVISSKILPRYPFFILTILQTYESFMPSDLTITAHGHCYYALILASLIKSGVSREDADINACLNFAERLAFDRYRHAEKAAQSEFDFNAFVIRYRNRHIIPSPLLNRMKSAEYGIVTEDGRFRTTYMHHFFLGRHLAKGDDEHKSTIEKMCENITLRSSYLTLLFVIHHAHGDDLVDEILIRTMNTLDDLPPATLEKVETKLFQGIVDRLPQNVLSSRSVEAERANEREARDAAEGAADADEELQSAKDNPMNDCYLILKSNEVLGQVIRNKYGSLEKNRLHEIVEAIADSGLRLVKLVLSNERGIEDLARWLHSKSPKHDLAQIRTGLRKLAFIWTMQNIERIVGAVNHPAIREILLQVVSGKKTPAYDLIGFFSRLDSVERLTEEVHGELKALLSRHRDGFMKNMLSIRTQWYMNTHKSEVKVEQAVCSLLGIKYRHRLR